MKASVVNNTWCILFIKYQNFTKNSITKFSVYYLIHLRISCIDYVIISKIFAYAEKHHNAPHEKILIMSYSCFIIFDTLFDHYRTWISAKTGNFNNYTDFYHACLLCPTLEELVFKHRGSTQWLVYYQRLDYKVQCYNAVK